MTLPLRDGWTPPPLGERVKDRLRLVKRFAMATAGAWRERAALDQVKTFVLFVGYPRSGHTIVGSLLDAHPDMVIAQELDVMRYVQAGFTRRQTVYLLLWSSRLALRSANRRWAGYDYQVPGQWQGRFRSLRVVGDKKADGVFERLRKNPALLARLQALVGVPVRLVHVVRNPFDNIATMQRRNHITLRRALAKYTAMTEQIVNLKAQSTTPPILDLRHEDFIAQPRDGLRALCAFLAEPAPDDWVEACAATVFASPHRSRHDIEWPAEARSEVDALIARTSSLAGYTFDEA